MKTYKNTEFQFEISYPQDWTPKVRDLNPGGMFLGKHVGDLMITISSDKAKDWSYLGIIVNHTNITSEDPYTDKSLDDLIARSLDLPFCKIAPELVSKSLITVNDMKAMKVISRLPQGAFLEANPEVIDESYFIFHNNYWYEISLGGSPEDFKTNRQLYDESLKSFKFFQKSPLVRSL
jgi:hypothetical protein